MRNDRPFMLSANNGVTFPIAYSTFFFNNGRSLFKQL
jgi:hypothetical protein